MIVRPRPSSWHLLFILRGSIIPAVAPRVLTIGALAVAVELVAQAFPQLFTHVSVAPFTLLGLVLSIFLSFRNGACYDRWWEGRKQWGQLVVEMRRLARQVDALLPQEPALRQRLLHGAIGFSHALNAQLRGREVAAALQPWLPQQVHARIAVQANPTNGCLHWLGDELGQALHGGRLDRLLYPSLAASVDAMGGIQAACERIVSTPLPFAYTLLLHRTALLFCVLLPFGVVGSLGWATPLLSMLLAYTFFGLDELGDQMEDPFGLEDHDLPLDAMTRTIEIELLDALGHRPLPAPLQPTNTILT